jgi:phage tail sheath protein FI
MPNRITYPGAYVQEITTRQPISGVSTAIAAFVGRTRLGPINDPVRIDSLAAFDQQFGGLALDSPLSFAVRDYFLNGGKDAIIVRLPDPPPGRATSIADFLPAGAADAQVGLHALDKAEQFNLLCIPPHTLAGSIEPALIDAAIAYCEGRRVMMIIDPPADWHSADDAIAGVDTQVGAASANAALYFPRIIQPNPLRADQEAEFAPCGAVAGVIARSDAQRDVWKAPAGLDATFANVARLAVVLTDTDIGRLNPLGINCLRDVAGTGRVIWGARTRRGADRLGDEWRYVPVRRTALFIEESLCRGLAWTVFEANDERLWAGIRQAVDAFMHGLFRQGAFQGRTPREAWFVKCDTDTTSPQDIANGIVTIIIGFAPMKPAEFVILQIQQQTTPAPA